MPGMSTHLLKRSLQFASASVVALALATGCAYAQQSDAAAPDANADDSTVVVVTASRIVSRGFKAPTPTTSISATDIANQAQPNIFTTIVQLPSLQGSSGD